MIEIIPDVNHIDRYQELSLKYNLGFEYNDFYDPELLDNKQLLKSRVLTYKNLQRNNNKDTIHGAFFDIIPFSNDSKIRKISTDRMSQSVEIGEQLSCSGVIFHTNYNNEFLHISEYKKNWLEYNIKTVEKLLKESSDIAIYYENMLDANPQMLFEIAQYFKNEKRFGVCLDVAHAYLSLENISGWFDKLSGYIKHFHINDNNLKYDEHLAVGEGKIPYDQVLKIIKQYKLDQTPVLLEVTGFEKTLNCLEKYMELKELI